VSDADHLNDTVDGDVLNHLAQDLLGRTCEELDSEERDVLARVAAGTYIGIDAAGTSSPIAWRRLAEAGASLLRLRSSFFPGCS